MRRQFCISRTINIAFLTVMLICISVFCCAAADSVPVCHSVDEASDILRSVMKDRREMTAICLVTDVAASDSENLIGEIFEGALDHTGDPQEGDYLRYQYSNSSASAKPVTAGGENAVLITYSLSYYDSVEQEEAVEEKAEEIIESLDLADKTEYEKVKAVYDYICDNVEYDYDNLEDDTYQLKHTAYGALIDGKAVCQGYSVAMYRLLLAAGVDNRVIFGTAAGIPGGDENHTWNIVKIGDEYYNTDVTGDDENGSRGLFLKGTGAFDEDHIRSEEYLTDEFVSGYNVSDNDYVADAVGEYVELLTDSLKAMAGIVADFLRK